MSRGKIKPKRPKRPNLPEKCTLMDCVRWVMYAENCSEAKAKQRIADAINSGRLQFHATREPDGLEGEFRVLNGKIVAVQ